MYCLGLLVCKYVCSTLCVSLVYFFQIKSIIHIPDGGKATQGILCSVAITRENKTTPCFLYFRGKKIPSLKRLSLFHSKPMFSQHFLRVTLGVQNSAVLKWKIITSTQWITCNYFISAGNFYVTTLSSYWPATNNPLLHEHQIKLMWKKLINSFLLSSLWFKLCSPKPFQIS